jgi:hypothetical protein
LLGILHCVQDDRQGKAKTKMKAKTKATAKTKSRSSACGEG